VPPGAAMPRRLRQRVVVTAMEHAPGVTGHPQRDGTLVRSPILRTAWIVVPASRRCSKYGLAPLRSPEPRHPRAVAHGGDHPGERLPGGVRHANRARNGAGRPFANDARAGDTGLRHARKPGGSPSALGSAGSLLCFSGSPGGASFPMMGSGGVRPLKASPSGGLRPALTGLVSWRPAEPATRRQDWCRPVGPCVGVARRSGGGHAGCSARGRDLVVGRPRG
jgi:hypothetical protein